MFAVIETGGKQYKVANNDIITVEKLPGKKGQTIKLDKVLLTADGKDVKVGRPLLSGTSVDAEILEQTRGDKIVIFKKKRRKNYRRKAGHRQQLTVLKITGIGGKKAASPKKAEAKKAEAKKAETKKTAKKAPAKTKAKSGPAKKTPTKKPAKKAAATKKPAAKKAPAGKKTSKAKEKK